MNEFDRYAIDMMQSVCIKEAGLNASGPLEEETSMIGLTFGGYLRSKVVLLKDVVLKVLETKQFFAACLI